MNNNSIRITPTAAVVSAIFGMLIIAGWIFDTSFFTSGMPGFYNFKFNTGVCFLLSSVSLFILDKPKTNRFLKILAYVSITIVLLITTLTSVQYIFDVNTGIDSFLLLIFFKGELTGSFRMYFSTCFLFILFNFSLLVMKKKIFKVVIQNVVLLIIVFLSTNFIIYVAKIHFTNIDFFLKTALNTSLLLIILYFGLFYSTPFLQIKLSFWKKISGYFVLVLMVLIIIFVSLRQNNQRAILISEEIGKSNEIVLKSQKLFSISKEINSEIN